MNSFFKSLMPNWALVAIGAVCGALLGVILYSVAFGGSEAMVIVQVSRIGGMESIETRVTPTLVIDRRSSPQLLIDSITTLPFTERVASQIGDPKAAQGLAARQYGGQGGLKARSISDGTLIEIRARASTPDVALQIVSAAADQALLDDQALNQPLRDRAAERLERLSIDVDNAKQVFDRLVTVTSTQGLVTEMTLAGLVGASDAQERLSNAEQKYWEMQTALEQPLSQNSRIFAPPAVVKPIVSSWLVAAIAGLIAGLALGYAVGILLKMSLRPTYGHM